jgi:hypothetical protein
MNSVWNSLLMLAAPYMACEIDQQLFWFPIIQLHSTGKWMSVENQVKGKWVSD